MPGTVWELWANGVLTVIVVSKNNKIMSPLHNTVHWLAKKGDNVQKWSHLYDITSRVHIINMYLYIYMYELLITCITISCNDLTVTLSVCGPLAGQEKL